MNTGAAFPASLPPLPSPDEMRRWDAGAIALGLPEILLMENAGRAALEALRQQTDGLRGRRVWLFMGGGNNGGDAACLARHLTDAGADALVLHTKPLGNCKGAAAKHVRLARAAGVPFAILRGRMPEGRADIVVDGLTGAGLNGELRPELCEIVEAVNRLEACFVLALDVPSGLNALTGLPSPTAIRAHSTVAFAAAKPGLVLPWARPFTGKLHVRDIGIPARARTPCSACLLDDRALALLPELPKNAYKNSFGHVLVLGGIPQYSGAAHLAARAALRTGAGLVSAAAPSASQIRIGLPEIMTLPLDAAEASSGEDWPETMSDRLKELLLRCQALIVGPGLGRSRNARALLAEALSLPGRPAAVVDADALVLLAGDSRMQACLAPEDVITPHPGEASALLRCETSAVQADRFAALEALCRLVPCAVVLKGAGCLVGQAGRPTLVSPHDIPQLAVGGSGDVLAGCLGALAACRRGEGDSLFSAGLGVALHAGAGLACAASFPGRGNTAFEIADAIPRARALAQNAVADIHNFDL